MTNHGSDSTWLGGPAPAPRVYPDRTIWRTEKDSRDAAARVRTVRELRVVIGGAGREERLLHSRVFKAAEGTELGLWSTGVLQDFVRSGGSPHAKPRRRDAPFGPSLPHYPGPCLITSTDTDRAVRALHRQFIGRSVPPVP